MVAVIAATLLCLLVVGATSMTGESPAYAKTSRHHKRFRKACNHLKHRRYRKAHKHLKALADGGHARSQTVLGMLYEKGVGVEKDAGKAYHYYVKAAEQGLPEAESRLGHFILHAGQEIQASSIEANKWLRRAAEHGMVDAQVTLGKLLVDIKNMPISHNEGIWWLSRAARRGSDEAKQALAKIPGADKVQASAKAASDRFHQAGNQYAGGMNNLATSWKGYADIVNTVNKASSLE